MATIVIDELITKLEYQHDDATLRQAEAGVKQLAQTNKAAAESADKLSAENRRLAEQTDALTRAQIDLSEQLAASSSKTDSLVAEQRELTQTIEQAGGATGKQTRRLLELDEEIARSRSQTKELREESQRLGREKQKLSQESRKVSRAQQDVAKTSRTATAAQRDLKEAMRAAGERAKDEAGMLGKLTEHIKGIAGGQLAADAIKAIGMAVFNLGKEIVTTGANFESLRARLKTVEGSTEAAGDAFRMIQDFAKSTPFEVENITEAFTALRVRGVQPTTDKLTALGDLSSAFGLEFKDTTDAIGAAARGELDPIEKLGITAKIAGDKISLSFKGQTEMVDRSAAAVTDALVKFGQMSGVQGAMAEQSMTTAGMFSNLKDTVSALFDQIAQMGVLDEIKLLMEALSASMGSEGLSQVIADVLVIALRTVRELFLSMPQETLIEFLQGLVSLIGMMAQVLSGAAGEQLGFLSVLFDLAGALLDAAGTVYAFFKRLDEMGISLNNIPGPIDVVITGLRVLATMWEFVAKKLDYLLTLLQPFLDYLENIIARLPSLNDVFSTVSAGAASVAADIGILNNEIAKTAAVTQTAIDALDALFAKQDYTKKTTAELQELVRQGDTKAEAEVKRRIAKAEQGEAEEGVAKQRDKKRDAAFERAERLLDNPGRLTRKQLESLAREPFTGVEPKKAEKLRDKAQKEIDKRDNKATKDGQKAAAKLSKSLLTADIDKQFNELAEAAGKRAAARAIQRSKGRLSEEEVNDIELAERKAVKARLAGRYEETGELPAGLAMDLRQTAALPNIEDVGGKLAPPVITVNNTRNEINITGNTFEANVNVQGGIAGTPQQIANATAMQAMPITYKGLATAIQNQLTNER